MKVNRLTLLFLISLLTVSCGGGSTSSSEESLSTSSASSELSISNSSEEASISESSSSSESLSSSSSTPEKKMVEKEIKVYRLFNRDNNYLDPDLSEAKYQLGSINMSFMEGQDGFIPYITLENVSNLYSRFYLDKENTKNTVSSSEGKYTWSVFKSDKEIFKSTIDINEKTFTYKGSFENHIETKKDYSKYSLLLRTKTENTSYNLPSYHEPLISYKDTEFEVVKELDKVYFPFSMMHTFYHELTGHDFYYNYTYLYEYNDVDDLSKASISDGESVYTPLEQMSEYINDHIKEKDKGNKPLMPMYLRKYHRSEFSLIMDNYYGLRKTWGVRSMRELYDVYGLYDKFIDENAAVRGAAYSEAFFMLSDSHTGRTILGDNPWIESNGDALVPGASRTDKTNERSLLSNALTAQREAFLKANGFNDTIKDAVIYSADGKTAYLGFDSFDAYNKAIDDQGKVKPDDTIAKYDTYFYFAKYLKIIKDHETMVQGQSVKVENVIIDDSLNGGGYVYIMGRLLALLSKNNTSTLYFMNDLNNTVNKQVYHVDTNNDGIYDDKDCYGNVFKNIYILTSPVSFSCGNAFPIMAQKQNDNIKIFGAKSGGGECVVGENYLSNGMGFVHSSNEHIIIYDEAKQTYEGVEAGVSVDGTLRYNDFYNMDAMVQCINKIK